MAESKTSDFHVRISPTEKKMMLQNANKANLSVSRYIVALAKQKKIYNVPDMPKYIQQISRIGVNINQIATVANTTKTVYQSQLNQVNEYLAEIKRISTNILYILYEQDDVSPLSDNQEYEKLKAEISEVKQKLNGIIEKLS